MKKPISVLAVLLFVSTCFSQNITPFAINSSGGSARSGYYQFEWSVGEMALIGQMSDNDKTLIITNGIIQPFILHPASTHTAGSFAVEEIKVFPNPADSYVEINFFTKEKGNILINIYDISGKMIYSKSARSHGIDLIERITVSHLPNAIYMLHINLDADQGYISKKGVYKIIKSTSD